jgi:DNA-binding beta-propeller fold protein YncE
MRILTRLQPVGALASLIMLAGCSHGGPLSIAPSRVLPQSHSSSIAERASLRSFDACPAKGPIEYVADANHNIINTYSGRFAGQAACGAFASQLHSPLGLYVQVSAHDLYVANEVVGNILVFHRGGVIPYDVYSDLGYSPTDVAVAADGTLIAANINCTLSTWIVGPNGGTPVGHFAMPNCNRGFVFLAIKHDGNIYYTDNGSFPSRGTLWSVTCPAGACGAPTRVAGVRLGFASAGIAIDSTGDVTAVRLSRGGRDNRAFTFELPNPKPIALPLLPGQPMGLAIDPLDHHLFVTDTNANTATEYSYPDGHVVGSVVGEPNNGFPSGIAVDP